MALLLQTGLLLADEPTTALDVTIQAPILELIWAFSREMRTGFILVRQDLGGVAGVADDVAVTYASRIVGQAGSPTLLTRARHSGDCGPLSDSHHSETLSQTPASDVSREDPGRSGSLAH